VALGAVIRLRRKNLGLSQEALADASKLDRSHMGKIERGERNVTVLNIVRIASALKTPVSQLFEDANL
jgi:transcriptional regulator with XRE-family HTH domain